MSTEMSDWGPVPEGIDLSETQTAAILGPVIALMILGIGAVVVRFVARIKARASIAIDDYLVLGSLVGLQV